MSTKEELQDLLWLSQQRVKSLLKLNEDQSNYANEVISRLHGEIAELKKAQLPKQSRETLENILKALRTDLETLIATETRLKDERRELERQRVREPDPDVRSEIQRKWNAIGPLIEENARKLKAVKGNITKTSNKLNRYM